MTEVFGIMCRRREQLEKKKLEYENKIAEIDRWVTAIDAMTEAMDEILAPYECSSCRGTGTRDCDGEQKACDACKGTGIILQMEEADK